MKPKKMKTIDEYCNRPTGSFAAFIKQKENFLRTVEAERKERIRTSCQVARDLSWAA
jgi:hypothetical protein